MAICNPSPDHATQSFRIDLPGGVVPSPGPASLLWHSFDEQLWNQLSYSTRGRLERTPTGWRYVVTRYTPGAGVGGPSAMLGFVFGARRVTRRYFWRRHAARPKVPWQQINAIKHEVLGR